MAKNINLNLGNIVAFLSGLIKNLRWLFLAVFIIMLVMEAFQVKNSFSVISNINQVSPVVGIEKDVRINFSNYNLAVEKIQQAAAFQPTGGITKNPFIVQVTPLPTQ